MTILGVLMQENNPRQKRREPKIEMTPELLQTLIDKAVNAIIDAQKVISRAVKSWIMKKLARNKIYIADIYFEADRDVSDTVYLAGEFSNPKWERIIPMEY